MPTRHYTKQTMDLLAILFDYVGKEDEELVEPVPPTEDCPCGGRPWNLERELWVRTGGHVVVYRCLNGHNRRVSPEPTNRTHVRPGGYATNAATNRYPV